MQQSLNLRAFSFERAALRTNFCDSSISQNNLGREDVIGGCSIKRRTRSEELFAIIPPMVARELVATSGPKQKPCGFRKLFS
jgi:hypothetical protein